MDRDRPSTTTTSDSLLGWARRTTTSFADFLTSGFDAAPREREPAGGLIYRLRQWPDLPTRFRTAAVFRCLSVMSQRPVNRRWLAAHSDLPADRLDRLLARLVESGAVECIDASGFPHEDQDEIVPPFMR